MNARAVAANALVRVLRDEAYGAAALSSELSKSSLQSRDRGLATEILYGVLRTKGYLIRRLTAFGKIDQSDHVLLSHLLAAAYQIDFLDRVPAHAAVSEAVDLVRGAKGQRLSGFTNAVLRKVAATRARVGVPFREAVLSSCPSWIRKRTIRSVGEADALELLAPTRTPRAHLRLTGRAEPNAEWEQFLMNECEAVPSVPDAYRYVGGGDPHRTPQYEKGAFIVQELGAQLVGHAAAVETGMQVLDACAGRGQKTSLFARQVGESGRVVATDLHEHKVRALEEEMRRHDFRNVEARSFDWTQEAPSEWREAFDVVVVDAPCTGTGTIGRRPEILHRLTPEDPARLSDLQKSIAVQAAAAVKPGGMLLVATCSVLPEEGPLLLAALWEALGEKGSSWLPDTRPGPIDQALFPGGSEPTASFHLLPSLHGSDGYFVARSRRN